MSTATVRRLGPDECWRLLRGAEVGRLAASAAGQLDVFPLNFAVDGGRIVFKTAEGTKLVELLLNSHVVFETDGWDGTTAWSVVAKGTAGLLEGDDADRAAALQIESWMPTIKTRYIALEPAELSGRSFERGPEPQPAAY